MQEVLWLVIYTQGLFSQGNELGRVLKEEKLAIRRKEWTHIRITRGTRKTWNLLNHTPHLKSIWLHFELIDGYLKCFFLSCYFFLLFLSYFYNFYYTGNAFIGSTLNVIHLLEWLWLKNDRWQEYGQHMGGGNVKWCSCIQNSLAGSQKFRVTHWCSNWIPRYRIIS